MNAIRPESGVPPPLPCTKSCPSPLGSKLPQEADWLEDATSHAESGEDMAYDVLKDPALSSALARPAKATPFVIAVYLTHQIATRELSRSTLEQGLSAIKEHYRKL